MKEEVRINLGSGPDGIDGWVNYDWGWLPFFSKIPLFRWLLVLFGLLDKSYQRDWGKVTLHDLRSGIPLASNSVDWIYSSNFLEHLEKYEAEKLLKDCLRVLKNGGKMRLVVPDLKKVVDKYAKNGDADVFCREFYGFDKDKNLGLSKGAIRGHQWMYDFESFKELVEKVGFVDVVRSSYRKSKMKNVDILDLAIHEELGLYLETRKG